MRTLIGGTKVEQYLGKKNKCNICGHEFYCGFHYGYKCMHTKVCQLRGPCCSEPPTQNSGCWEKTPYIKEWKKGQYKK
jgi:hypothetical protein